jgi:serine/threonine protein kinase
LAHINQNIHDFHHPTMKPQSLPVLGELFAEKYLILEVIGEGGFGTVFRAQQQDSQQEVALKILRPDNSSDPTKKARFFHEAELVRTIDDPNIVRLIDVGQTEQEVQYIAWELLQGCSLEQVLNQPTRMSLERVVALTTEILHGLAAAHHHGVVHRDIKPGNIFLCESNGQEHVKLLDFGVAKLLGSSVQITGGFNISESCDMIGTPNYMAPEQVMTLPLTPATDLYSLGLVMAEMISGQVIMTGKTSLQICIAQASEAPVPLPASVLESPLGLMIQRATQKNPEFRYASAHEMLNDLKVWEVSRLVSSGNFRIRDVKPADDEVPPTQRYASSSAQKLLEAFPAAFRSGTVLIEDKVEPAAPEAVPEQKPVPSASSEYVVIGKASTRWRFLFLVALLGFLVTAYVVMKIW